MDAQQHHHHQPPPVHVPNVGLSSILPHVPLPVATLPAMGVPEASLQGKMLASDPITPSPSTLQRVADLLNATDTSYVHPTCAAHAMPASPILEALLQIDPQVLGCKPASSPAPRDAQPKAARIPTPVTSPLENGNTTPQRVVTVVRSHRQKRKAETPADGTPQPLRRKPLLQRSIMVDENTREQATQHLVALCGEMLPDDDEAVVESLTLEQLTSLRAAVHAAVDAQADVPLPLMTKLVSLCGRIASLRTKRNLPLVDSQAADEQLQPILEALEAASCALLLMSAPNAPPGVVQEEVIEAVLELLKHNLQYNVYCFVDGAARQLYRPHEEHFDNDNQEASTSTPSSSRGKGRGRGRGRGRGGRTTASHHPAPTSQSQQVLASLEAATLLVAQLMGAVRLQPSYVLPYIKVALASLSMEGIPQVQMHAAATVLAAFVSNAGAPERQQDVMGQFLSEFLRSITSGTHPRRTFLVDPEANVLVHLASALLVELVQCSATLPGHDETHEAVPACFKPVFHWADTFWAAMLDAVPQSKAAKSDAELDVKTLLEVVVADLIALHTLPEWPAASVVLLRGALMLGGPRGVQHADPAPRLVAIDLLGTIVAQLWRGAAMVDLDAAALHALLDNVGCSHRADVEKAMSPQRAAGAGVRVMQVQQALLGHLGALQQERGGLLEPAASALTHVVARLCAEDAMVLEKASKDNKTESTLRACLTRYRELVTQCKPSDVHTHDPLSASDARRVMAAWVYGGLLGHVRTRQLQLLVECCDPSKQAPTTRTRAMRALGMAVEADPRVLGQPDVQQGVSRALEDESVAVRDAAVELLGRHIGSSEALALAYFDVLGRAAADPGTSVRKRALRILLDSCARVPQFPRATEACVHVLLRVTDEEESIQGLVVRALHELWMSSTSADVVSSRASQLAAVALSMYDVGGRGVMQLPFTSKHKLVSALHSAATLQGTDHAKTFASCRALAVALLDGLLDTLQSPGQQGAAVAVLPFFLALHALSLAFPAACVPPKDQGRFIRCLVPYIKAGVGGEDTSPDALRVSAAVTLCTISTVDCLLEHVGQCAGVSSVVLSHDLVYIVNNHLYVQAVAAACKCLCTLAAFTREAAIMLQHRVQTHFTTLQKVKEAFDQGLPSEELGAAQAHAARHLYTFGQYVRYGMDMVEDEQATQELPSAQQCLQLTLQYLQQPNVGIRVQESALQACGMILVVRPRLTLSAPVKRVMQMVMAPHAAPQLKARALANIADMLRAEAARMVKAQPQATASRPNTPVAVVNNADDATYAGSAVQTLWEDVLRLALDPTPLQLSEGPHSPKNATVRTRALDVVDLALSDGLVAPWTALPTLVALTADPVPDLGTRALRLLRREETKAPQQYDKCLSEGVPLAYTLYKDMARAYGMTTAKQQQGLRHEALQGLCGLYTNIIQSSTTSRHAFLTALLKPLDRATDLHSTADVLAADPHQLCFLVQLLFALPLRRGDEGMRVLQPVHALLWTRGEATLDTLKSALQGVEEGGEGQGGGGQPLPEDARAAVRASLILTMLLMLKASLCRAYGFTTERVAAYGTGGDARKHEERVVLTRNTAEQLPVDKLDLSAADDRGAAVMQYKVFKHLMAAEAANVLAPSPAKQPQKRTAAAAGLGATPQTAAGGRGRDGRGSGRKPASGGRGRGRGRSRGRGRKRRADDSSTEEEDEDDVYSP